MSREKINNVEPDQVGTVVQDCVKDEAKEVVAKKNASGKWDVTGTYED